MNYRNRKNSPQALRFAERRRREDEAPRLSDQVPDLVSLEFQIEDRSGQTTAAAPRHIRRIVIDRAPALFLVPCSDPRCSDGEHDVTTIVMRALRAREKSFEGNDECTGNVGLGACARVMHFEATADYRAQSHEARR